MTEAEAAQTKYVLYRGLCREVKEVKTSSISGKQFFVLQSLPEFPDRDCPEIDEVRPLTTNETLMFKAYTDIGSVSTEDLTALHAELRKKQLSGSDSKKQVRERKKRAQKRTRGESKKKKANKYGVNVTPELIEALGGSADKYFNEDVI